MNFMLCELSFEIFMFYDVTVHVCSKNIEYTLNTTSWTYLLYYRSGVAKLCRLLIDFWISLSCRDWLKKKKKNKYCHQTKIYFIYVYYTFSLFLLFKIILIGNNNLKFTILKNTYFNKCIINLCENVRTR